MKNNVMILIFYIFFLSHSTDSIEAQKKSFTPDQISAHYYYLTKLTVPIHILSIIKLNKNALSKITAHIINNETFNSPTVNDCIQKMHNALSLRPLFNLWYTFNAYCFLDDHELKREFCILILLFYKNALTYFYIKEKKFILAHINAYYENINNKKLHELLEILTIISQELRPLLESMQTSKATTWKAWIKKYWMPIAFTSITIVIKIMIYEKTHEKDVIIKSRKHSLHDMQNAIV